MRNSDFLDPITLIEVASSLYTPESGDILRKLRYKRNNQRSLFHTAKNNAGNLISHDQK